MSGGSRKNLPKWVRPRVSSGLFFVYERLSRAKKTAVVNGGLLFQSEYVLGVLTLHFTVDKQHNDCANHRHNKAAEVKTVNLAKAE
ncbi:hypothetical protein AE04_01135 [Klebsiella aerogenes MGH 78]|nr:hypothetical protein AE04_01135 [Klebsiella aerogenes MGH 78]